MSAPDIKELAINTIKAEANAIGRLAEFVDDHFVRAVSFIYAAKGRVIVTGIGKSAIIASKIVATLNSTGTPAIFMHAADAIHGDLGIIQPDDVVICISKSGNTPEIKVLVPLIKNLGNSIVAIVSNADSYLGQRADYLLRATVEREACPNNLAPTSSTTAQLVLGDALAICLLKMRGFSPQDFAKVHPGGALGKKLYTRVRDICSTARAPQVHTNDELRPIIVEISSKMLGATAVLDTDERLVGIITDGDLRRMLQQQQQLERVTAADIMSKNPKTIEIDELAIHAFNMMEKHKITQLLVVEGDVYKGVVHLHDILREGVV